MSMGLKQLKTALSGMFFIALTCGFAGADALADEADLARGGRIYSDWMIELDEKPPHEANPAYTLGEAKDERSIKDSWRCVSCHGWDYKGVEGSVGITGSKGKSLGEIMPVLENPTHDLKRFMTERDLQDLALFISEGLYDKDKAIDAETGQAKGDMLKERAFFETVCAMCHGAAGQGLPGISLGRFAKEEPYLTLHSIFNGHPGAVMPALRAFDEQKLIDLLAYMQTLPTEASLVSIVRGGRLYDDWIMETGLEAPIGIHPSYPREFKRDIKAEKTWLCKECHGWDYKGLKGQYAKGKHFTGVKGIDAMVGANVRDIIDVLKDENHEYGRVLSMKDLLDLANFVSEGQVDMTDYIEGDTKQAIGDAKKHAEFYPTLCGNCHGAKGRAIRTMGALGRVANQDPWKALHKILNGHPAEEMPAWRSLDVDTIHDLMKYIQTLPENKRS